MTPKTKQLFLLPALVAAFLTFAATPALAAEGLGVKTTFGGEVNKTKVEEFNETGNPHGVTEVEENVCTAASGDECQAGKPGEGPGQFGSSPRSEWLGHVAVNDETGDVYVADTFNNRVQIFSSAGTYLSQFPVSNSTGIAVDNSTNPSDPSKGDVYVGTTKFSATGKPIFQLNTAAFEGVGGIATDPSGDVWVVAYNQGEGALVQEFSDAAENAPGPPVKISIEANFSNGLAVDSEENWYVIGDFGGIHKFSKTGHELGTVCSECAHGVAVEPGTNGLFANQGPSVAQYGPFGESFEMPIFTSRPGILIKGHGIAVNASHQVYAVDGGGYRVLILERGSGPKAPETLTASGETSTTAVLHGKLKSKSKYYFGYNVGGSCTGGLKTPVLEGEGEVSEEVTNLQPSAKYTYCLIAENIYIFTAGNEQPFETLPAPPEVIGESASNVTEYEGVFEATINPNNQETTYSFEYSTEGSVAGNTLAENTLTGEEVTTAPGESAISGFSREGLPVSVRVESLRILATYYYRVVATNAKGETATGKVQAYTKLPIVTGEGTSVLTSTSVKLAADVNPDFQGTKYQFEYATGKEGKDGKEVLEDGEGTVVPGGTGTLEPNLAPLASHCNDGSLPAPSAGGSFACDDGSQPACENGVTPTPDATSLLCPIPVSVEVFSLQPGQTYYYRVVAENEASRRGDLNANKGRPVAGTIESFTPFAGPAATTGEAQSITRTSATLFGTVNPQGAQTSYSFQYISETAYQAALGKGASNPYTEGEATAPVNAGSGAAPVAAGPTQASGLQPNETYRYRLTAKNSFGVQSVGEEATLKTTTATPPAVSTGAASGIGQNTATLSGTVTTNGLQTNYGFEITTTPGDYGPATGLGSIGGAATETVSVTLGELAPGTTYYYRVTATNADGTEKGQPESFTTPGFPTLLNAPGSPAPFAFAKVVFPKEEKGSGTTTKSLTNKQKLAKALKQCKKGKSKSKRTKCEAAAHQKYGGTKGKKKR